MYYMVLKLNAGKTSSFFNITDENYRQTMRLGFICYQDGTRVIQKTSSGGTANNYQYYWTITPEERVGTTMSFTDYTKQSQNTNKAAISSPGLKFYAVADNYTGASSIGIFSSVITFYTGFVLVVGTALSNVFKDYALKIWLTDAPNTEKLIRICDGITAAQVEGDLVKEERLYWELVDIMRSPEMLKKITGSYLNHRIIHSKYNLQENQDEKQNMTKSEELKKGPENESVLNVRKRNGNATNNNSKI